MYSAQSDHQTDPKKVAICSTGMTGIGNEAGVASAPKYLVRLHCWMDEASKASLIIHRTAWSRDAWTSEDFEVAYQLCAAAQTRLGEHSRLALCR